ncbi:DUF3054 domain-containing protein [Kroppenstedtia pulmonis]|uniref:DUF3054 domain-containing protein n=1 Tax=Kroppenstedtia pulmonis TaxID=1380685 RepID=A0A7D3Y2V1_9BACL|nr:DUF3054 domain-containing protein [Kroppenstedtia pulmonis]QKG83105.1 DUF3054 domain-containing protein [Kroppenstedtia pulmonis]
MGHPESGKSIAPGWYALTGDLVMILIFAIVGRLSHDMEMTVAGILQTAVPFVTAWIVTGVVLGLYRVPAVTRFSHAWRSTVLVTAVSVPIALVIRAYQLNEGAVVVLFQLVSWVGLLLFMLPWRLVLAALYSGKKEKPTRGVVS